MYAMMSTLMMMMVVAAALAHTNLAGNYLCVVEKGWLSVIGSNTHPHAIHFYLSYI